jgi:hypothetical protein
MQSVGCICSDGVDLIHVSSVCLSVKIRLTRRSKLS